MNDEDEVHFVAVVYGRILSHGTDIFTVDKDFKTFHQVSLVVQKQAFCLGVLQGEIIQAIFDGVSCHVYRFLIIHEFSENTGYLNGDTHELQFRAFGVLSWIRIKPWRNARPRFEGIVIMDRAPWRRYPFPVPEALPY
jgi:hypothetical protein